MCGIAGILNFDGELPVPSGLLREMVAAIRHRGPDDDGFFQSGPLGMGMRRLSILDIANSRQPLFNEDRTLALVYNGEIYNYRALTAELEGRGHRFSTSGDGEAILHLYEEHGPACLEHLRGMFAFALWDSGRRRLMLARDRLGIKPLYYACDANRLLFGSELKSLLCDPSLELRVDRAALHDYLTFLYVPQPRTIFRDVHKLPPASFLMVENGRPRIEPYWKLAPKLIQGRSEQQWLELLQDRWTTVVADHLQSDVPVGVFLSGGVDSSLIVSAAAARGRVNTFTVGFDERDFNETAYARRVAERFGTSHTEIMLQPAGIDLLDRIVAATDEPFADASALPTFLVCRAASAHVKVALSGAGGDELFGGYWMYVFDRLARHLDWAPRPLVRAAAGLLDQLPPGGENSPVNKGRRLLKDMARDPVLRHLGRLTISNFDERDKAALYTDAYREALGSRDSYGVMARHYSSDRFEDLFAGDATTYLIDDLLTKVDRMSMANSLEVRVPFLDHLFVELALSIPGRYKVRGTRTKCLLKKLAERTIPRETIYRKKQGFSVPLAAWFRGDLAGCARDALAQSWWAHEGIFDHQALDRLLREHTEGRRDNGLRIWQLMVLEHWTHSMKRTFTL